MLERRDVGGPGRGGLHIIHAHAREGFVGGAGISGASYSKACVVDADCVAVVAGNVCSFCNPCWTTDAIAASEKARYDGDVEAKRALCPPDNRGGAACSQECPRRIAVCSGGTCVHVDCAASSCRDAG